MIVAGIDVGGKNVHAVIMNDGKILAKVGETSGMDKAKAAEEAYEDALKQARLERKDVIRVVATGSSGKRVTFADGYIADAAADARGIIRLIPTARTVIDVGAEEGRAIKVSPEGKVLDFAINEKCAAGTGTFVDTMARALEINVEEMAKISLNSTRSIPMNAQCSVFGESEVVGLIHQKTSKEDIARSVHDAIAGRVGSVARIVGLENDIVMIGGMARNVGFLDSLRKELQMEVTVPDNPDYVGAIGAATAAESGVTEEKVEAKVVEKEDIQEGK
ncbi:MAG: acyl-CoA dehydratase activase [Dehalococcoidales bacterium]|nr:acyl-CoA dehydratase activase [Dehalococcoidales bacterium]